MQALQQRVPGPSLSNLQRGGLSVRGGELSCTVTCLGVDEPMLWTSKLGLNHIEIHRGVPSSADE